jgi:hypothetical protein
VSTRCKNLLAFVIFSPFCFGGVASNPFLRPGSNRPPPQVTPPPPPPKPAPNPAIANEVEFRGYFLLKGIPHFCIFNKKANLGEWIKLTEKTYEEFEAQAFDLESETLTLAFNGQDFTLTLEQSKSTPMQSTPASTSPKVKLPPGVSATSTGSPKTMPPKPRTAPQLPDWLASRMASRSNSSLSSSPTSSPVESLSSSSSRFRIPPARAVPNSSIAKTGSSPVSKDGASFTSDTTKSITRISEGRTESPSAFDPTEIVGDIDKISNSENQSDLDDLPPPPPPPNILPPSPPPDIIPSLDE